MNCRNCGAAMELFERRRYYYCRYCGTFEFIEAPAVDGVHVLERPPRALPCPLCRAPLAKSLLDDSHLIQYCERCRGILMASGAFAEAIDRRRARQSGPRVAPEAVDQRELKRQVTCPSCRTPMDVHPYYGPGNVVIDSCSRCNLVWLDFGELRQITEAPGHDRGRARDATNVSTDSRDEAEPAFGSRWTSLTDILDIPDE